jgi:hypothetical protein
VSELAFRAGLSREAAKDALSAVERRVQLGGKPAASAGLAAGVALAVITIRAVSNALRPIAESSGERIPNGRRRGEGREDMSAQSQVLQGALGVAGVR